MTIFEATYEDRKGNERTMGVTFDDPFSEFDSRMDMYLYVVSQAFVLAKAEEKLTKIELIAEQTEVI